VGIRAVTLVPIVVVAIMAADSPGVRVGASAAMVVLVGWSVVYALLVRRGASTAAGVADAVVLCGLGLLTGFVTSQSWLEASRSWIRPFVMFAAVGYQYSIRWTVGVPLGLAVCTTSVLSAVAAQDQPIGPDIIVTVVWSNIVPMLARLLFGLLTKAAHRADAAAAVADRASLEQVVAERVRQEQRDISDSLHDTASTTLLMVALGQVGGAGESLRERARTDLDTIRSVRTGTQVDEEDLGEALRSIGTRSPLRVDVVLPPGDIRVPPRVVRALVDAAGEALTNVARHSGTDAASVRVERAGDAAVVVEVSDRGRGFRPELVSGTRRGLRASIMERIDAVGGHADVRTTAGAGTTVRLEWPR